MYTLNSKGPKMLPCGTPSVMECRSDNSPFINILCCLSARCDLNHLKDLSETPKWLSLRSSTLWFRESNALEILTNSRPVTLPSSIDSRTQLFNRVILKAAHLTRTKHPHQVTLWTLHILPREAFLSCNGSEHKETAEAWALQMIANIYVMGPYFAIYKTLILIFVQAQREKNFPLYVNVLEELALLFFALDHDLC